MKIAVGDLRRLVQEMSHYAPIRSRTTRDFPRMKKEGQETLESSLLSAARACDVMGDKGVLMRRHKIKTSSGVVKVESEGWKKGRLGLRLTMDPKLNQLLGGIVEKFGLSHIVYASYGMDPFTHMDVTFGAGHVLVPLGKFKTVWSPVVEDVGRDADTTAEEDIPGVIDTYEASWPDRPTPEVLLDVPTYYLINLRVISSLCDHVVRELDDRSVTNEMPPGKTSDVLTIKTYSELSPWLSWLSKALSTAD